MILKPYKSAPPEAKTCLMHKEPLVAVAKALRKGLSLAAHGFPQCTMPTLLWLSTKNKWLGLGKECWHGFKKDANSILLRCKLARYIKLCLFNSFILQVD